MRYTERMDDTMHYWRGVATAPDGTVRAYECGYPRTLVCEVPPRLIARNVEDQMQRWRSEHPEYTYD